MRLRRSLGSVWRRLSGRNYSAGFDSAAYWEDRYSRNERSGDGSYGYLASYKAAIVNGVIAHYGIKSVVEFGCGDGAQLSLFNIPEYVGLDVSETIIKQVESRFRDDHTKRFHIYPYLLTSQMDMAMSLDVIFHLVEDHVFRKYMTDLFSASRFLVILYSSATNVNLVGPHVRHRNVKKYVDTMFPRWTLINELDNPFYPRTAARFYIYSRLGKSDTWRAASQSEGAA